MKKVRPEEGESVDIVSENIERLKELFPDAFSEGEVDFDVLRQLLGDAKVLDEGEEKYGLVWHGKKKARQIALTPSTGTLLPCPEESVDWDTTKNLFIEGDNLEVLKLLQKSYANKVKMIYIDPPYNTGGEFIYPDKFQENIDTYLRYTRQIDDEGFRVSSNTESTGRKHTNWINMMYPRLKIAKNLLRSDGLVFVSIDDNEVHNLRHICDEIFGAENFVDSIVWKKRYGGGAKEKYLVALHEYTLLYCKDKSILENLYVPLSEESIARYYKSTDENEAERGPYRTHPLEAMKSFDERENLKFPISAPDGTDVWPKRQWRWGKDRVAEALRSNEIEFSKTASGDWVLSSKQYLKDEDGNIRKTKPFTIIDDVYTQHGTNEIVDIFGNAKIFGFPKPSELLAKLITIGLNFCDEEIVLDFFAGSASIAHAMMKLNVDDRGKRRYILVQLPEPCDEKSDAYKAGYKTIAAIGKDRIKKSTELLRKTFDLDDIDCGFKVFKLSSSNINKWNPNHTDLEESLLLQQEHLIEGRSEQDILYELLLKRGVDLAVPIHSLSVGGKDLYSIGYGVLFACLDESIKKDQIEEIGQAIVDWHRELAPSSDTHVFFRDSAFNDDVSKTNMAAILEQNGINHVRSL